MFDEWLECISKTLSNPSQLENPNWSHISTYCQNALADFEKMQKDLRNYPHRSPLSQEIFEKLPKPIKLSTRSYGTGASPDALQIQAQDEVITLINIFWSPSVLDSLDDSYSFTMIKDPVLIREESGKTNQAISAASFIHWQKRSRGPNNNLIIWPSPGEAPQPDILLAKLLMFYTALEPLCAFSSLPEKALGEVKKDRRSSGYGSETAAAATMATVVYPYSQLPPAPDERNQTSCCSLM